MLSPLLQFISTPDAAKLRHYLLRVLLPSQTFERFRQTPQGPATARLILERPTISGFRSPEITGLERRSTQQLQDGTRIHGRICVRQQGFGHGRPIEFFEALSHIYGRRIDIGRKFGMCDLELLRWWIAGRLPRAHRSLYYPPRTPCRRS